jgi:ferredoxin
VNDRDPQQVPSYKVQTTLGEMVRRDGNVDTKFMLHAMEVCWSRCTCCSRCAQYCPHGIDMGQMISYTRGLLYSQGFVPWELKIGSGMHRVYRAQMDVTEEDWVETCEWMAEENEEEYPGLTIPWTWKTRPHVHLQRPRAQALPRDVAEAPSLPHRRREVDRARNGWELTALCMFPATGRACKMQVQNVYDASSACGPKRVVAPRMRPRPPRLVIRGPYWWGRPTARPRRPKSITGMVAGGPGTGSS